MQRFAIGLIFQWKHFQEIAAKPDYMTDVDYIDLLIETEKGETSPGWQERIQHLQNQRDLAVKMNKFAHDPKFDPFQEYRTDKEKGWMKYVKNKFDNFKTLFS